MTISLKVRFNYNYRNWNVLITETRMENYFNGLECFAGAFVSTQWWFLSLDRKKWWRALLPRVDGSREQNNVDEKALNSKQLYRTVVLCYCIINHFLIIGALDIILMKLQRKLNALHCNNKGSTFITWFIGLMTKQINK